MPKEMNKFQIAVFAMLRDCDAHDPIALDQALEAFSKVGRNLGILS